MQNLYAQFVRRQNQQQNQYQQRRTQTVRQRLTPAAQTIDQQIQVGKIKKDNIMNLFADFDEKSGYWDACHGVGH
jgi:hypothetical protein